MSDYRYKFTVSLGYSGSDREAEIDLVEDLDYAEEALSDESYLNEVLKEILQDEESNYIESWWEKI